MREIKLIEIELIKKYGYDQKKAHDLLKEEYVKDILQEVKDLVKENIKKKFQDKKLPLVGCSIISAQSSIKSLKS